MQKLLFKNQNNIISDIYYAPYLTRTYLVDNMNGFLMTGSIPGINRPNGTSIPFKSLVECINNINTDIDLRVLGGETKSDCKYLIKLSPGTYTENILLPECGYLRFESCSNLTGSIDVSIGTGIDCEYEFTGKGTIITGDFNITGQNDKIVKLKFEDITLDSGINFNQVSGDLFFSNSKVLYNSSKNLNSSTGNINLLSENSEIFSDITGNFSIISNNSKFRDINIENLDSSFTDTEFTLPGIILVNGNITLDSKSYSSLLSQSGVTTGSTILFFDKSESIKNDSRIPGTTVMDALNHIKDYFIPDIPGSDSESENIVAFENMSAGSYVNMIQDTDGIIKIRKADNRDENKFADGYIRSDVLAGEICRINVSGVNEYQSGLIKNERYFLGINGGVTMIPPEYPAAAISQLLGRALSTTVMFGNIEPQMILA